MIRIVTQATKLAMPDDDHTQIIGHTIRTWDLPRDLELLEEYVREHRVNVVIGAEFIRHAG